MVDFEYVGLPSHAVFGAGVARGSRFVDAVNALGARRLMAVVADADGALAAPVLGALGERIVARSTS